MKKQDFPGLPYMPDLRAIEEQENETLQSVFKEKIEGWFLIDIKDQVIKALGLENFMRFYDFRRSPERMIKGIGEAAEYDICRIIVGIHRAHSIFLSSGEIRKNEKSGRYKKQLISETLEKIKLRFYGSVHFRKNTLFHGEEFLYYPLPYELFAITTKMNQMLVAEHAMRCEQLYYGIVYNGYSVLSLLGDNLLGTAYPLCRGAIEMYLKLLILNNCQKLCDQYETFRSFEVAYACSQTYPQKFIDLFEKRACQSSKAKAAYLHFGWVDFIEKYHKSVKKSPYSVYGIITFLKTKNKDRISELEILEKFYKACHAYTHGSIQTAKYPLLHYFEISIMLYYIMRGAFLLMCEARGEQALIDGSDVISMIDRDFDILYEQYNMRSTEMFEIKR